ncbi:pectate lyase C [Flagelloscypha sp. PMI_526]|nr:pectate lyase C [Flagelloscypha sp. PMI_526]
MFSKIAVVAVALGSLVAATPVLERAPTKVQSAHKRAATNVWPSVPATSHLSAPITVSAGATFTPSSAYTRYDRGSGACNGQAEGGDSDAVFLLQEGATLSRVVIGADQSEGIHCLGSCTLDHVWFEDVCEDAITIKQSSGTSRINYGGAKNADDKIVQHNGGGTVIINSFYAQDFGKVYRSCGNCGTQYKRTVNLNDVWAVDGSYLVGINKNYGDVAKIRTTKVDNVDHICTEYTGNSSGDEPTSLGDFVNDSYCQYTSSDVTVL